MSAVGTSALLGSLVDLDVLDDEVAGVKTLGIGVGLSVLEQGKEELGGLDGPAGLADTELLACGRERKWLVRVLNRTQFFISNSYPNSSPCSRIFHCHNVVKAVENPPS